MEIIQNWSKMIVVVGEIFQQMTKINFWKKEKV